ncbi:hypothetical protein AB1Y20_008188 [Prymnesium parvum]|uniref:Auxin efflux carrier component n=1 Tax=Prymnesium parvum TaxID=97485 RepID=A0AB34IW02_PRYPA
MMVPPAAPPSSPPSSLNMGAIATAALGSVLQAAVLASAGLYLGRKGFMTKAGAKLISTVSMKITIPCLLFSSVLPSVNLELVGAVWPMLLLPFVFVGTGALLGYLVVLITRPPANFRKGTIAAVAFGNSTGMPIVLLSVLQTQLSLLEGPSSTRLTPSGMLQVRNPIVYLSIYLLTYPIIQWVAGGWLLAPVEEASALVDAHAGAAPGSQACNVPLNTPLQEHTEETRPTSISLPSAVLPAVPPTQPLFLLAITDGEGQSPYRSPVRRRPHSDRLRVRIGMESAPADSAQGSGNADHAELSAAVGETSSALRILEDDGDLKNWDAPAAFLGSACSLLARCCSFVYERFLVPPVIGVLCGLICSSLPPTYYLLCGGTFNSRLSTTETCPTPDAYLGFLTRGIAQIGNAAVPLNLILLGNSLSKGPDWKALPVRCNVGIVVAKMVVMPALAVALMVTLDKTLGDDGSGYLPFKDPFDEVFYLAAAAVTATPTANNMMVMIEVAGGDKTAMATAIFSQYMVAPVLLTGTLTLIITILQEFG